MNRYEEALVASKKDGVCIRGLILCHPHNPLGRCYPQETLIKFMQLCSKYEIHLICDEVYALSVYEVSDPEAFKFESTLSLETESYISSSYFHLLYGMSKDMAASGVRLGCIYTRKKALLRVLSALSVFH